ncbi:MAG TPA: hypothetical protein VMT46_09135 [Anaerolineaceae bacterium]|nr:hypothetical protein [Anaerolineaceae bacterium]
MAEIRCPMCSKWNPAELDECQYCHARLKPLIAPSPGERSTAQPQLSTPQPPSEPEGETPDWLNSLRAKQDAAPAEGGEESNPATDAAPSEEVPDWLARIRERETEERPPEEPEKSELPDWLTSSVSAEFSIASEGTAPAGQNDLPDWLRTPGADQESAAQEVEPEPGNVPDWLEQLRTRNGDSAESPADQPAPDLSSGSSFDVSQTSADTQVPSWLNEFEASSAPSAPVEPAADLSSAFDMGFPAGGSETASSENPSPAAPGEIPDWLRDLGPAGSGQVETPPTEPEPQARPGVELPPARQGALPPEDLPEWLSNIAGETPAEEETAGIQPFAEIPEEPLPPSPEPEVTEDWLASFKSEMDQASTQSDETGPVISPNLTETPDWLSSLSSSPGETGQPSAPSEEPSRPTGGLKPASPHVRTGLTGWLGRSDEIGKNAAGEAVPGSLDTGAKGLEEMPDWLAALQQSVPSSPPPPEESAPPTLFTQTEQEAPPVQPEPVQPVAPFEGGDLPDWISDLGPTQSAPAEEAVAPVEKEAQPGPFLPPQAAPEPPLEPGSLAPAELPSWVQAMRPVEDAAPEAEPLIVQENDQRVENLGPLAGLRGILPAEPSAGDYRRPPTYSVKLQVNETQRRSAQILEDLLASENVPVPPKTERLISSQRILRVAIALIIIVAVIMGSLVPLIPIPNLYSPETLSLKSTIDALPDNAPVLLAADYEPSLAGEMQASSSGVVSHLMQRGARLAIITTTPTGSALAGNLLNQASQSLPAAVRQTYTGGEKIAQLGYLAGGPAALLEFARNPQYAAPAYMPDHVQKAWDQPVMSGVQSVMDFKAVIVLTDNVDTGRAWLEQFQPLLPADGSIPFLMVTSAQAAPMLRAYLDSGQVQGMVSGLAGGAAYEQLIQSPGPGSQNWNGFQAGMLVTLILVLAGGLIYWISGLANRRKTKEEA